MGANYWLLGDIRIRMAELGDERMFHGHFLASPAEVERAFDLIDFPPSIKKTRSWLSGYQEAGNVGEAGVGNAAAGSDACRVGDAAGSAGAGSGSCGGGTAVGGSDRRVFVIESASEEAEFLGYIDVWEADRRTGVFKTGVKMLENYRGKGIAARAFTKVLD